MSKDKTTKGGQKGAQEHAEGMHGEKTHARFIEQIHSKMEDEGKGPRQKRKHSDRGEHRLLEDREQHDEAEKNSERERLSRLRDEKNVPRQGRVASGGRQP